MPDQNEKIIWFNSLPFIAGNYPNPWQRFCPCGVSVSYHEDCMMVRSWIDLHFGHTAPEKKPVVFEYDWTIPWKFSEAGFGELVMELGLVAQAGEGMIEVAEDRNGRVFRFFRNYAETRIKNKYEGVYLTFIPEKNEAKA